MNQKAIQAMSGGDNHLSYIPNSSIIEVTDFSKKTEIIDQGMDSNNTVPQLPRIGDIWGYADESEEDEVGTKFYQK